VRQNSTSVISNATPLIYLGKLGQLGLLLDLYSEITIPYDVYVEVVLNGLRLGAPEASVIENIVQKGLITVRNITYPDLLPDWAAPLDQGEISVILLAQERPVDFVLIDNLHARRAAVHVKCNVKGTVGILLDAVRLQHLSLIQFELLINQIMSDPTFWISERLCEQALMIARKEKS